MDKKEVLEQSKRAMRMWGDLWKQNARETSKLSKLPMSVFMNKGIGKRVVCVAMGPSLEKEIEALRNYQDRVDIICVDKAFGYLLDNGIKPDFVLLADAQVSYETYCEPYISQTENIGLIANVNSNCLWGKNWRGARTYYVNKDNINSEDIFKPLSGVYDEMPAGSNVSNALLIYASYVMKYDKYFLAGYDFSWSVGGKFYAGDEGHYKKTYLNQMMMPNRRGDLVPTSENLWFSVRWIDTWVRSQIGVDKVVDCSDGLLTMLISSDLKSELSKITLYQRKLTQEELVLAYKRTLVIEDKESYEQAKLLINSSDDIIYTGVIEYNKKEDGEFANAKERKFS